MVSNRDKKAARDLMRADPDLNYTTALRQVQPARNAVGGSAGHAVTDMPTSEVPARGRTIALDEAHDVSRLSEATREIIGKHLTTGRHTPQQTMWGDPFAGLSDTERVAAQEEVWHLLSNLTIRSPRDLTARLAAIREESEAPVLGAPNGARGWGKPHVRHIESSTQPQETFVYDPLNELDSLRHLHGESEVKALDINASGGTVLNPVDPLASEFSETPSDNDVEHQSERAPSQWNGTPVSMDARESVAYPLPTWPTVPVEERTIIGGPLPVEDDPED